MNTSILLERHAAAGARLTMGPAGETPLTFGDVPGEYRAATQAAMVFDQTDRGLVSVRGKDALDFLHRITANRIKGLAPGCGNANLLLTGKGKIVEMFDLEFLGADAGYLLSTPPGRAASLKTALDMYLFTEDVQLGDETESHAPLALIGPAAESCLCAAVEALGLEAAPDLAGLADHASLLLTSQAASDGPALRVLALPTAGRAGFRLEWTGLEDEALTEKTGALWQALTQAGAQPGGLALFDILRTEAAVAAFGVDIDDTIYPQEARLEDAFSLEKGCYIGQEVVAKIDTYGGLNKRLFALATGEEPLLRGARLWREDPERGWRDLGVVTSWAWSFALDTGLALAYVKRRHQEPGTVFHVAPADAEPEAIAAAPTARLVETPLEPAANPA
jgi:folate-binding protein YgfZ